MKSERAMLSTTSRESPVKRIVEYGMSNLNSQKEYFHFIVDRRMARQPQFGGGEERSKIGLVAWQECQMKQLRGGKSFPKRWQTTFTLLKRVGTVANSFGLKTKLIFSRRSCLFLTLLRGGNLDSGKLLYMAANRPTITT